MTAAEEMFRNTIERTNVSVFFIIPRTQQKLSWDSTTIATVDGVVSSIRSCSLGLAKHWVIAGAPIVDESNSDKLCWWSAQQCLGQRIIFIYGTIEVSKHLCRECALGQQVQEKWWRLGKEIWIFFRRWYISPRKSLDSNTRTLHRTRTRQSCFIRTLGAPSSRLLK